MGTVPDGDSDLATEIQWAYERQLEGAMAAWSSACAAGDYVRRRRWSSERKMKGPKSVHCGRR